MRPKTIILFEDIMIGSLAVAFVNNIVNWRYVSEVPSAIRIVFVPLLALLIFSILVLLVARKRSKIAMWILVVLSGLQISMTVALTAQGVVLKLLLARDLLALLAFAYLAAPASRRWMRGELDHQTVRETFS